MKRLAIFLCFASSLAAQTGITWAKQSHGSPWPGSGGFYQWSNSFDPVSGTFVAWVEHGFSGTVSVVNGSSTATWVSGDYFSKYWHNPNVININSTFTYIKTATWPGTCGSTPISCTTFTMSVPWAGATGTYGYTASSTSIYGDTIGFYNVANNTWTYGPGLGTLDNYGVPDQAGYPSPRQNMGCTAVDTKRNRFYMGCGATESLRGNATTNGTSTVTWTSSSYFVLQGDWVGLNVAFPDDNSCATATTCCVITAVPSEISMTIGSCNHGFPNGITSWQVLPPEAPVYLNAIQDTYYLSLNSNVSLDTWTQVPITFNSSIHTLNDESWTYDSVDDGLIQWGETPNNTAVFCSNDGNPGGTLTAAQTGIGCATGNQWALVTTTGNPLGYYGPTLIFDAACNSGAGCVWNYGGAENGSYTVTQTDVYRYVPSTKTWSAMGSTNQPPQISNATIAQFPAAIVLDTHTDTLVLHVPTVSSNQDWVWNPNTNAWTTITTSGNPPQCISGVGAACPNTTTLGFYATTMDRVAGWTQGNTTASTVPELWIGTMPLAPTFTSSATLATGTQSSAYTWTFTFTGNTPITCTITSGSLPTGVFINTSACTLSGTPSVYGTFTFTVTASNGVSPNATQNASLTINPVCSITSTTLPAGKLGVSYSQQIPYAGCASSPPTFSVTAGSTNLSNYGLSVSSGGVVGGTPLLTGVCSFTVGVTDAQGNPSQAFGITFVAGPGVMNVGTGPGMTMR